jgi:Fe2+ transport system protein B
MTDTRPGEISRREAQRIAEETASLLKIADNEREYREHVLVTLARLEVKFDSMQESFEAHVKQDEDRHTTVTQNIRDNTSWINKGLGMVALLVVMIGVIMWLIDKATP